MLQGHDSVEGTQVSRMFTPFAPSYMFLFAIFSARLAFSVSFTINSEGHLDEAEPPEMCRSGAQTCDTWVESVNLGKAKYHRIGHGVELQDWTSAQSSPSQNTAFIWSNFSDLTRPHPER